MELVLVLCLCISTWTGKTLGDENGFITVNVSQGSNTTLPCSPTKKEDLSFKSFKWRKDGQNVFYYNAGIHYNHGLEGQDPQFKGRVSFFNDQLRSGNASIQIQNAMIQDSGTYSCEISGLNSGNETFHIKLDVNFPTCHAPEDSDVILPCSPIGQNDLRYQLFDWKKDGQDLFLWSNGRGRTGQEEYFKNRVDFFQHQLQFGNASILIKSITWVDSGIYSCEFPKLQPQQKFYIRLVVCHIPTFSSKQLDNVIMVNCSVSVDSTVEMELHNSDGTVIKHFDARTSKNTKYFTFNVTKNGDYRCLVKYKEGCNQMYSEYNVLKPGNSKATVGLVVGLGVALVALVLAVVFCLCKGKHPVKSTGDGTKDLANPEDVPLQE